MEFINIIISIFSLFISFLLFFQTKRHNYLSVKPIAYILPKDYEDYICVVLQNKGTGPLITKSIKFINKITNEEKPFLIDFMPQLLGGHHWSNFSKATEYTLIPNEDKILIEYNPTNDKIGKTNKENIRKALKSIEIIIEYQGIYGENTEIIKKSLNWYGRHFE